MAIVYDENQLTALTEWAQSHLGLVQGKMYVVSCTIPEGTFAADVRIEDKKLIVYTNPDSPMTDTTVNVLLGYVLTLAYERAGWEASPSKKDLYESHAQLCEVMLEFNEEFAAMLETQLEIMEKWLEVHEEGNLSSLVSSDTEYEIEYTDTNVLAEEMTLGLFSTGEDQTKWRIN